jgi:glycosyltransferase involved in cell wall biosynthesis
MDEYLNASVYLMTSRSEALPMVLLEAKACGLPIVSFNCKTGPAEIIKDGKDGYLIECYDINRMAEKLSLLCSQPDLRKIFGSNAREDVKRFLPEVIGNRWDSLLQNLNHWN